METNNCTATKDSHPLLAFSLFAYNQEQFVADAVMGALSQGYSPLEIILWNVAHLYQQTTKTNAIQAVVC